MSSPFPNLQIHPESGLSFPWCEWHGTGEKGSGDLSTGGDGVALAMVMLINWVDLGTALSQLLGYSWRDMTTTPATLRRKLPWQNAYSNQLWVKNISGVKGIQLRGKQSVPVIIGGGGGAGGGFPVNQGPASIFQFAELLIHFWRPPYYIRTDDDIKDNNGVQQEWLRYVDKNWQVSSQILSRESTSYVFTDGPGAGIPFQGSVGQKLIRSKVRRRWYEIPEAALFQPLVDATPQGIPNNLLYSQTQTTNPITNYVQPSGQPIVGCVNSPKGGGVDDSDATKRFFGCYMGTLLYVGIEFIPRPLQLPPALMQIPTFTGNEAISQVQYDVVLEFDLFDPPVAEMGGSRVHNFRGHNLAPYSGNGMWYPIQSQQDADGMEAAQFLTPFQYADFTDLFKIL